MELAATMKATGGTAPAASLYPYYQDKKVVKTFIVVTDEEENQGFQNEKYVLQTNFSFVRAGIKEMCKINMTGTLNYKIFTVYPMDIYM